MSSSSKHTIGYLKYPKSDKTTITVRTHQRTKHKVVNKTTGKKKAKQCQFSRDISPYRTIRDIIDKDVKNHQRNRSIDDPHAKTIGQWNVFWNHHIRQEKKKKKRARTFQSQNLEHNRKRERGHDGDDTESGPIESQFIVNAEEYLEHFYRTEG